MQVDLLSQHESQLRRRSGHLWTQGTWSNQTTDINWLMTGCGMVKVVEADYSGMNKKVQKRGWLLMAGRQRRRMTWWGEDQMAELVYIFAFSHLEEPGSVSPALLSPVGSQRRPGPGCREDQETFSLPWSSFWPRKCHSPRGKPLCKPLRQSTRTAVTLNVPLSWYNHILLFG